MTKKTILIVDDEQGYLEALADALEYEGYRVLKATNAETALSLLRTENVQFVTVDVMLSPGPSLDHQIASQQAGVWLCEKISKQYPGLDIFCLSVVSDEDVIRKIQSFGVRFIRKGETPLRTVLSMINARLTGLAYSTDWRRRQ